MKDWRVNVGGAASEGRCARDLCPSRSTGREGEWLRVVLFHKEKIRSSDWQAGRIDGPCILAGQSKPYIKNGIALSLELWAEPPARAVTGSRRFMGSRWPALSPLFANTSYRVWHRQKQRRVRLAWCLFWRRNHSFGNSSDCQAEQRDPSCQAVVPGERPEQARPSRGHPLRSLIRHGVRLLAFQKTRQRQLRQIREN